MSYDVAIVGLGTAGAAAAALCARAGLRVVALERRPRADAGARWVNGVPAWTFDAAGIARPERPELRGGQHPFHIVSGWGPHRVTIPETGVLEVDMRHLVTRLQAIALEHHAELREGVRVTGFDGERIHTDHGTVEARWYVNASGIGGAMRSEAARGPSTALCTAAQQVHELVNDDSAQAFLHEHGVERNETLCFTGVAGGYSIINVRVGTDEVSVLTGSIPAGGHDSGRKILNDFVEAQAFIGPARFGGARAIPIDGPARCIAKGRLALIGDVAGQVHAAHGSGVGHQLLAARLLADTLSRGETPTTYNLRWQRAHGAYLTWSALFCRFSQSLAPGELDRLVSTGTLHPGIVRDVLRQKPPRPTPASLAKSAFGLAQVAGVRRRLGKVIARRPILAAHFARYPARPQHLEAWSRNLDRILGTTDP